MKAKGEKGLFTLEYSSLIASLFLQILNKIFSFWSVNEPNSIKKILATLEWALLKQHFWASLIRQDKKQEEKRQQSLYKFSRRQCCYRLNTKKKEKKPLKLSIKLKCKVLYSLSFTLTLRGVLIFYAIFSFVILFFLNKLKRKLR